MEPAAVILPSVAWGVGAMTARKMDLVVCFARQRRIPNRMIFGLNASCGRSYAAIDLDPPQYNNDGRDKRGQHQQIL
jgi:hypothetical protein